MQTTNISLLSIIIGSHTTPDIYSVFIPPTNYSLNTPTSRAISCLAAYVSCDNGF